MRIFSKRGFVQLLTLRTPDPLLCIATYAKAEEEDGLNEATYLNYEQVQTLHAALEDWLEENKQTSLPIK